MDRPDAMRVLAEGRRFPPIVLATTLLVGGALVATGLAWALVEGLS